MRALLEAERLYPGNEVVISAQCYLEGFYADFAFVPEGDPYEEDGIPHIQMRKPVASN